MPDRVREAIFDILRGHVEGQAVLDCFAGAGGLGLEAHSRGASRVVLVEKDKRAAETLQRNVDLLGAGETCEVVVADALGPSALNRCPRPVHMILFDPPYAMVLELTQRARAIAQLSRLIANLDDDGYAVLRTPWPCMEPTEEERAALLESLRPARRGGQRTKTERREVVDLLDDQLRWREDVAPDGEDVDEPAAAQRLKREKPRPVDLRIEKARGPETHPYGTMALHLYMKAR